MRWKVTGTVTLASVLLPSTAALARDRYKAFCSVGLLNGANYEYVAVTEVFETDLSIDDVKHNMERYLYDVGKGRVQASYKTSGTLSAYCVSGDASVRRNHINYYRPRGDALVTIASPLDPRGYYRRRSNSSGKPPIASRPTVVQPTSPASAVAPKGPTPNQLKYQRELESYKARLADIDRIKKQTASKHAADKAAAEVELARHRAETARADAARRQYEVELANHQRRVTELERASDRERKVEWREAVVVCNLSPNDGQSRFGNWRCDGPLQMTYAKLGSGTALNNQALVFLSQACGGRKESIRDLGMVSSSRVFGCGFGLHPITKNRLHLDAAEKHGISFVPGRAIYRCPMWKSACRTQ